MQTNDSTTNDEYIKFINMAIEFFDNPKVRKEDIEDINLAFSQIKNLLIKLQNRDFVADKNYLNVFNDTLKIENTLLKIAIQKNQFKKARRIILIILDSLKLIMNDIGKIIIKAIEELNSIIDAFHGFSFQKQGN